MDSMKSHVSENVKNALKSASAKIAVIPGGLTKKLQPLDIGINRSFKSKVRKLWEQWMSDGEKNYTKTGKLKRASYENVSRWVLKAWNDVAETTICYGMIYGISTNALSQQLNTTKENAFHFMETFKNSYPGLNAYFQSVIRKCSTNGYVSTLMQRRRYLPLINSENRSEQSHAERQAINTTIQGSAADLIKTAMIKIEKTLQEIFPDSRFPYSSIKYSSIPNNKLTTKQFRGAFLVLQMHDELIFEVNKDDLEVVLKIVKDAMEKTTKLSVKLPVQVRTGITWGEMTEIT
ncbi:DNA polymerase theta [Trichonephila clavipes]|nr:DNA polymerase theta [Trichonephila clavipes]